MNGNETMLQKIQHVVEQSAPSLPPPIVVGLQFCGVPLSDWVLIATLIYTSLLIINNLETLVQKIRRKR